MAMEADDRLVVYGHQNGQGHRGFIRMTPKQRRRYWQKWFKHNYVAVFIEGSGEGEVTEVPNGWLLMAKKDRRAPNPMWLDRPGVWSDYQLRQLGVGWHRGAGKPVKAVPVERDEPRRWEYPVG